MNNLKSYKYLLEQLNDELQRKEIRFSVIHKIKKSLVQRSQTDFTTGLDFNNVVKASINILKTETDIILNKVLFKIKEEKKSYIFKEYYFVSDDEKLHYMNVVLRF